MKNRTEGLIRSMVIGLLAVMFVVALVYPAYAAEPSSGRWSGFYGGPNVGYGWGNVDAKASWHAEELAGFTSTQMSYSDGSKTFNLDPDGLIGGLQLGYGIQKDTFVFGIETDFLFSDLNGSKKYSRSYSEMNNGYSVSENGYPYGWRESFKVSQSIDWLGTLRLRAGVVAAPSLLIYATGGLAYARVKYKADYHQEFGYTTEANITPSVSSYGAFKYPASFSRTDTGWTVGGGAEYAINNKWSIKVEYLYIDLGDRSASADAVSAYRPISTANGNGSYYPAYHVKYKWDTQFSTLKAGLNYRF